MVARVIPPSKLPDPNARPAWVKWLLYAIGIPAFCCIASAGMTGYQRFTLDSNPVYVGALKRANANARIQHALGTPLTVTAVYRWSVSMSGQTSLVMGVAGPNGTGTLVAVGRGREADSLEIDKMRLMIDASREIIALDGGHDISPHDDFKF